MARRIDAYAIFFRSIDENFSRAAELTQMRLLELHSAEGLRRAFLPVRFLVENLHLPWHASTAVAFTEQRRITATITTFADRPWAVDLAKYYQKLQSGRPIALRTLRFYVASAAALLDQTNIEHAQDISEHHIKRHLKLGPGRAANLQPFFSYLTKGGGPPFPKAGGKPTSARRLEARTLMSVQRLLSLLESATDERQRRASLVAAISIIYQVPRAKLLSVKRNDLRITPREVEIGGDLGGIILSGRLAQKFRSLTQNATPFPFVGRNRVQPLSTTAVEYHVAKRERVKKSAAQTSRDDPNH